MYCTKQVVISTPAVPARVRVVPSARLRLALRASPTNDASTQEPTPVVLEPMTTAAPAPSGQAARNQGFGDLMAFAGPAPEAINGRLAMLGFVAALGAELSTGETVLQQVADAPALIFLTFVAFASASLVPMLLGKDQAEFGPFRKSAEILNGRAAMIGFASLLIAEAVRGSALF